MLCRLESSLPLLGKVERVKKDLFVSVKDLEGLVRFGRDCEWYQPCSAATKSAIGAYSFAGLITFSYGDFGKAECLATAILDTAVWALSSGFAKEWNGVLLQAHLNLIKLKLSDERSALGRSLLLQLMWFAAGRSALTVSGCAFSPHADYRSYHCKPHSAP